MIPSHLQSLQRLLPVGCPVLEGLDKGAGIHGLDLDDLIIQDGLDLISAADDKGP